jgi:flagellar basal-body rod protein FlgB
MNETIELLNRMMDATALRQRVLANNLANADTPQFHRRDVEFRSILADALETGGKSQLEIAQPRIFQDNVSPSSPDGNNVSAQTELGEMVENSVLYNFATKALMKKYNGMTKAIKGGATGQA